MKIIGALFMILASSLGGLFLAKQAKEKILLCDELIKLCDYFSTNIKFSQRNAKYLLEEINDNRLYSKLDFLSLDMLKNRTTPNTFLEKHENERIGEFIYNLGKFDVSNQIKEISSFREYVTDSKRNYQEKYRQKGKIYVVCGISFGIIFSLVLV